MSCYRTTDNKYDDAPPRMADGRHFTDYRQSCDLNNGITKDNNVKNSFETRLFLQRNASNLMDLNRANASLKNSSKACGSDVNDDIVEGYESTMLPEKYKQVCNGNTCDYKLNDSDGLGLGREYFTENLRKQVNVTNQTLGQNDCRKTNEYLNVDGYTTGQELYNLKTAL